MLVHVVVLLLPPLVSLCAGGSSSAGLDGTSGEDDARREATRRNWVEPPSGNYLPPIGGSPEEEKPRPLEISKSIELAFDPNVRAFVPVAEAANGGVDENVLVLFSERTYRRLKKIFRKLEGEKKRQGRTRGVKNFQTGRFKHSRIKRN